LKISTNSLLRSKRIADAVTNYEWPYAICKKPIKVKVKKDLRKRNTWKLHI
jgi:hypothetical protein